MRTEPVNREDGAARRRGRLAAARRRCAAFTLVEIMVAVSIVVMALSVAMAGFLYLFKSYGETDEQTQLDIDVQHSMELLKRDLRLSALNKTFFYPSAGAVHTAMSFPLARDSDGDGLVDMAGGQIAWNRQVIYHVWPSVPNELRVTAFDPRDNSLTDAQLQQQLESVVQYGDGRNALGASHATTRTIFKNLFQWDVRPRGAAFDAYAPEEKREVAVDLGSCILAPGAHLFTFRVTGRNPLSSGYAIGLDSLFMSPCGAWREAEAQLPAASWSGPTPQAEFMPGGSWDGNYQLLFDATQAGSSFDLRMENDRWEETNFKGAGSSRQNTAVLFDSQLAPKDYVVQLDGNTNTWLAAEQTGDGSGNTASPDTMRGRAVRVVLRGEEMLSGAWIHYAGAACQIAFRAGDGIGNTLEIVAASIGECASTRQPVMDATPGTIRALTFSGSAGCRIAHLTEAWSDLLDFPIDPAKSYLVTFLIKNATGLGTPWRWHDGLAPGATSSYVIADTNGLTSAAVSDPLWSSRSTVAGTNAVIAVSRVLTTYPLQGTYTSPALDTQQDQPAFKTLQWNAVTPPGTTVGVKVRSGARADMADAPAWSNVVALASPGAIPASVARRRVQFQLNLVSSAHGLATPKVQDVTITWNGVQRVVDVGGTFTVGPQYGQFEVLVDNQPLTTGLLVDLELYRDVRGFSRMGSKRITSAGTSEVVPRNTGR